jgi:hypothetical protein
VIPAHESALSRGGDVTDTSQPRRLAEATRIRELVGGHIETMVQFVEHFKGNANGETSTETRRIVRCALVVEWQEPDGSEYVTVAGDEELSDLGIKGMLHDGIYAMAHRGDPGYSSIAESS